MFSKARRKSIASVDQTKGEGEKNNRSTAFIVSITKLTSKNRDIMVIFMPYYRQHGQFYHSRSRPSTSSAEPLSSCTFGSNIVCRFVFSFLLLLIAFFIFELSIDNPTNQREGTMIIAIILLIIAFVSFVRTVQTLRRYDLMMKTRRRWIDRSE